MWSPTGGLRCNNQCAEAAMKSHYSEDACGACLARGRRVAPLDTTREVLLLWAASGQTVEREWVARLAVCWECRAAVERMAKFCRRVRTAQALLASAQPSVSDDVEQFTCLSTLGSRTKIGFDYECCHYGDTDTDLPGSLTDEDHDSDTGHKKSIWEIDLCPIVNLQEDKYSTNIPVLEEGSFLVMNDMTNKKQRNTVEKDVNVPDTVTVRKINGSIVKRVDLSELTVKKEGEMELPEVRLKKEKMELSDLTIVNAEGKELSDIVVKKLEKRDFSEVAIKKYYKRKPLDHAIKKIEAKKPIDRAKRKIETRKPFDRTIKEIKSTEAPDLTIVNAVELSDVTIKKAKTKSKKIKKTKRDVEESAEMESSVPIILTEATYIPSQRPGKISTVLMSESEMQAAREADRRAEPYVRSPFKCETCVLGFASHALLEEHDRGKHAPELGDYTCDVCATRLASAPQLAGHRRAHYAAHACGACGHAERRLAAARRHAAAHAPERTYACRHCGQQFRKLRQVRYHRETKHRARRECPLCRKTYSTRTALIQHLKIHSGLPLCECAHCGKSYRGKGALVAHMRTHAPAASENAYCAECDAQFKNEFIYRAHLKSSRRHVRKEDLKYQCDACDKSFVHPGGLRHHYDYAHLRAATYKCDACDKIFVNMRGLKRHTRTLHEGVRPAKNKICGVCGKAFLNKKDLIQHQDIHTGARPYSCDICASTFRQSSALYTHRRLVHLKIKRNKGTVEA